MTSIVQGTRRYTIRVDGRVDIELASRMYVGVWLYSDTVDRDFYGLPSDIRFPCNQIDQQNAIAQAEADHD